MAPSRFSLAFATFGAGALLAAAWAGIILHSRSEERIMIDNRIIDRDADLLYAEALQQLAASESASDDAADPDEILLALLRNAYPTQPGAEDGILGAAVFGGDGKEIQVVPATLVLAELSPDDYPTLLTGGTISRYD